MATMDLKIPWSKNLAYNIQSGKSMYFLKMTTTLWIEIYCTNILHLTIWFIYLDEADGVAKGFSEAES